MASTTKVIFKAGKCPQDPWFSMVRTLEAFSHVCSHYRMALFFCTADYASKASLSITTRKLVFHHYQHSLLRWENSSFVDKGGWEDCLAIHEEGKGPPNPRQLPCAHRCSFHFARTQEQDEPCRHPQWMHQSSAASGRVSEQAVQRRSMPSVDWIYHKSHWGHQKWKFESS